MRAYVALSVSSARLMLRSDRLREDADFAVRIGRSPLWAMHALEHCLVDVDRNAQAIWCALTLPALRSAVGQSDKAPHTPMTISP